MVFCSIFIIFFIWGCFVGVCFVYSMVILSMVSICWCYVNDMVFSCGFMICFGVLFFVGVVCIYFMSFMFLLNVLFMVGSFDVSIFSSIILKLYMLFGIVICIVYVYFVSNKGISCGLFMLWLIGEMMFKNYLLLLLDSV